MNAELPTINRNQADRAKQGVVVFSRVAERDLFAADAIERVAMWQPFFSLTSAHPRVRQLSRPNQ